MGLPYLHPLSLLGSISLSSVTASLPSAGALGFPWADPVVGLPTPSKPFQFEEPLVLSITDHCQDPRHPLSVLHVVWMPGPLMALHLGWTHWGEAGCKFPCPAYVFECQRDGCHSWHCTPSLTHPLGVGYGVQWAHPATPWLP